MELMKGLLVFSLLILLIISAFSMTPQVRALQDNYSHLSNMTLNQEQIKEIEADRDTVLNSCSDRIGTRENPGKLCDAYADYLVDKCKRIDNLLGYCQKGLLPEYESARIFQLTCENNPPSYNDTKRIKSCLDVTPLNSSYTNILIPPNIPPKLSVTLTDKSTDALHIMITAENPGQNLITLANITYSILERGSKLSDGCIAYPTPCRTPESGSITVSSGRVVPLSSTNYDIEYLLGATQNRTLDGPFILNGTYYFQFPDSKIEGEKFNFKVEQKRCQYFIAIDC